MKKIATTEVPINNVIAQRWSPRAFDSSFIITSDEIKSLLKLQDGRHLVMVTNLGSLSYLIKKMQPHGAVH